MKETRQLVSRVLDQIDTLEEEYLEKIYLLEDVKQEKEYLNVISNDSLNSIEELLRFYSDLTTTRDINNFNNFVLSILKDENDVKTLIEELENLKLLTSTGLLKYAQEQQSYSKKIINSFINKLAIEEDSFISDNSNLEDNLNNQLSKLKEFRQYFSPIGIIKEVRNIKEFNESVNQLKLNDCDKTKILFMAFDFNIAFHENELKKYKLDLPLNKDLTKKVFLLDKNVFELIRNTSLNETIDNILKKVNSNSLKEKKLVIFEEYDQEKIDMANKTLKDNKDKDAYELFVKYYEMLLNDNGKYDDYDLEIVNKAKEILNKNIKLLNGLTKVINEDLEATLNIYKQDENLRELVYKTTENINRLISYEIKDILEKASVDKEQNIKTLANKLKPAVEYFEKHDKKKKRSR